VKSVLDTVIEEIMSFREKHVVSKELLFIEFVILVASFFIIFYAPIDLIYLTIYSLAYPTILFVLGFRKPVMYIFFSFLLVLASMTPFAILFGGSLEKVYRFSLTALTSISLGALILSSLNPASYRNHIYLYLLIILLNQMFREIRDVFQAYRSRGESGLKLYARVLLTSILITVARKDMLIDSLRARGFNLE